MRIVPPTLHKTKQLEPAGVLMMGLAVARPLLLETLVHLAAWCAATASLVLAVSGSPASAQVFDPPAALGINAASDSGGDYRPQVVTDGTGSWMVVWESDDSLGGTIGTDTDILVSRSSDGGVTWTAPAALNTNAASDSGDDRAAQVVTDGAGSWVVVWHSYDSLGATIGTDGDILVARSSDGGATWAAPTALNSNAASDAGDDWFPQVATDGAASWVAVWQSRDSLGGTISADWDILVAHSSDGGATWTAPTALNSNAASDSGDDEYPQVATDGAGSWVAFWQSSDSLGGTIGTDRDILVSRSSDGGATWTAPAALNTNAASDSGDDRAPQVVTDGGGSWVAVWHSYDWLGGTIGTDADILVSHSSDVGATWTAPAALGSNAASDSGIDYYPQIVSDGAGSWLSVWHSYDSLGGTIGTDADILVSRSSDGGATWAAPAALGTNAASDSGGDVLPRVATDGAGSWVAVWYSNDSLGGAIGTDYDILFALGWGPDLDGDGIPDDGDGSGTAGDAPCSGGETEDCDDNCPDAANADQVNSNEGEDDNPVLAGLQAYGNVCDPDLDNDGDIDGMDRLMQLACFRGQTFPGFDCADADLVGSSLSEDPDPGSLRVDGLDRLQMLRWFRSPGSVPGELP
jgi:hypothetical protein